MKKNLLLAVGFMLSCGMGFADSFTSGNGTEASPYLISNAAELQNMKTVLNESGTTVFFELAADVDMAGVNWKPFNAESPYKNKVSFDGKGHVIRNFTCHNEHYASFAGVMFGTIKNVAFVNADVSGDNSSSHIGIIAGYLGTSGIWGEVDNVYIQGKVTCTATGFQVGGLAGNMRFGKVSNCLVDVNVTSATAGDLGTGGIAGYQYDGKNMKTPNAERNCVIENSYFCGSVSAPGCTVGGILGKSENRWGNYMQGCISNARTLVGNNDHVGAVCGQVYPACVTAGRFTNNYALAGVKMMHGTTVFSPTRDATFNQGVQYHGQLAAGTPAATAQLLGWDSNVWTFTGTHPQLKLFAVLTGVRGVTSSSRAVTASAVYTLSGQRVAKPSGKGLYIVGGRKVVVK